MFDLWPATLPDTSATNKIAAEAPGKERAAEKRKEEDKKKKEFEEKLNSHNRCGDFARWGGSDYGGSGHRGSLDSDARGGRGGPPRPAPETPQVGHIQAGTKVSNVAYVKECKRRKVENATTLATASSPILAPAPAPAPTQAPSTPDSAPDPLSNTLDGHNLTKEERKTVSKED